MTTAARSVTQQYQSMQCSTADRGQLLLLMFDGALRFLAQASASLDRGDVPKFAEGLMRAQAIIAELMHTLDHKAGGEIAANLERLYHFMLDHLVEANLNKSARHVLQVHRILGIIAGAFREVIDKGTPVTDAA